MQAEIIRDSAGGLLLRLRAESEGDKTLLGLFAERSPFSAQVVATHGCDNSKMPYEVCIGPVPVESLAAHAEKRAQ